MVLLLTHSGDYYTVDLVQAALQELGTPFFRVNTDLLPVQYPVSVDFTAEGPVLTFHLEEAPVCLSPTQVKSVWCRRLWPAQFPEDCPQELVEQGRPAASQLVLDGLGLFRNALWMNSLQSGTRAESKILQLALASEIQMPTPETLITNEPEKIREFFHRHQGKIITKLLVPTVVSMEFNQDFAYTCMVAKSIWPT